MQRQICAKVRTGSLRRGLRVALLAMLAGSGGVVCAGAQTAVDGAIVGRVLDGSGAVVAGATVRVQSAETTAGARETRARVSTNGRGEFVVARVAPGEYSVRFEAVGFEASEPRVVVEVGGVAEVLVRLRLKGPEMALEVNADAELSGVEGAASEALTSVAGQAELARLPANGRRWQSFALLAPGVSEDDSGEGLLSFRGLPATQNSTTVDGMSGDQSFGAVPQGSGSEVGITAEGEAEGEFGNAAGRGREIGVGTGRRVGAVFTFSQEAVREFRVNAQNYSAVYGHAGGGVINTVSKSGTDALHGTGFYLVRTSGLAATNAFSIATSYRDGVVTSETVKPHDLRHQFGGSVGGPAVRGRLFYFYALDLQRRGFPAVSSPGYASFYALTAMQSALLANRGVTATKVNAALNYLDSLTGTVARRQDQIVNFLQTDWKVKERQRVSVEYNRARMSAPGGGRDGAVVDRGRASLGNSFVRVDTVGARWLWTASGRTGNEIRAHWGKELQYETAQAPLTQEPAIGVEGLAPEVSIGPQGLIFGTPASLGKKAYPKERRWQVNDVATWTRGRHVVQVGGDVSLVRDEIDALNNEIGTFTYDSSDVKGKAGGLVDWITDYTFNVRAYPNGGCPSIESAVHNFCFRSYTQSFGQQSVAFDTQEWAGFVEDGWRVTPGLHLQAGLRYEYELLPFPQQPNAVLDEAFGARGATSVFPEDRNNLGARLGLAWEPLGKGRGVVRVGYGQYFGRLAGGMIKSALEDTALASSTTHVRIVPAAVTGCPQVAGQGFGYVCSYTSAPPAAVGATTSAMVFDRRFRLPAVQQGSFALEREIGLNVTASVTYMMDLDRQLPNSVDINIAPSVATQQFQISGGNGPAGVGNGYLFMLPVYSQRVSTSWGPVTDLVSNENATYHAMVVEARRRSRKGLEFRVGWTWAKAMDFGQSSGASPRTNGQFDPFDLRYDKGLAALGRSHRMVASAAWETRGVGGREWMRRLGNGWVVAPVFTESSGRPYSYNVYGGTRLSGGRESLNGSGGAMYLPTVGRNTLRLPEAVNLDVRVSRGVKVRDGVVVRGMLEGFNVGNRVNYTGVTERAFLVGTAVGGVTPLVFQDAGAVAAEGLNVRPFGTYTAAGRERQVQLGLRVEF